MVVTSWTIRRDFVAQISAFTEAVEIRILPAFDGLEAEADRVANESWEKLQSSYGSPDDDPAAAAEMAHEAGLSHYFLLTGIRQGFLNLAATALYHLFEQQMLLLLRRQVLHPREEDDPKLMSLDELRKRLMQLGLDMAGFVTWAKVVELRALANSVKHAEGRAANELRALRPDLFIMPVMRGGTSTEAVQHPYLFLPLAGEDLYVQLSDLKAYAAALVDFLNDLAAGLEALH